MRSRIFLAGAVVAVAMAVTPATLASGGRNPQTAGLQVALRAEGLYRGPIDAISGPETVAATRAFQQMQGLPVTGLADARTRAAMGPLGGPLFGARTLHHGAFGWDVAVLQFLLVRQGISVPINAYYDRPTLHGVRLMQARLHLRRDGVVGPHTFSALVKREPVPLAHHAFVAHHKSHHHRQRIVTAVHVVRAGESLSSIARHYHTTVAKLARRNHLDPSHFLLIGARLHVPRVRHVGTTQTHRVAYRTQSVASVRALLDHWAAHYGVSVHLVRALAWMESGYNNALVSSVGARGIMQLLPYDVQLRRACPDRASPASQRERQRPRRSRVSLAPPARLPRQQAARARRLVPGRGRGPEARPVQGQQDLREGRARAREAHVSQRSRRHH